MRRSAIMVTVVTLLAANSPLLGKKKTAEAKPNGARPEIRGAVSVVPVPWGLVSLGGRALRQLPHGKQSWETLHEVPGGNLYRIAAHPSGKLLAAWEKDPDLHLFIP